MFDTIVKNGIVCTASETYKADIGIKEGKIAAIAPDLSANEASTIIDAEGAYVTPGGVDAHVHLAEPLNLFGKMEDDFESGTRSAAAGGTTTIVAFVSQDKNDTAPGSLVRAVHAFKDTATNVVYGDYAMHMILADPRSEEMLDLELPQIVQEGVTSVKMYMTYKGLQVRDDMLMTAMLMTRKHGVTTMLHAENGDAIEWMVGALEKQNKTAPVYHAISRPQAFEAEATNRAIMLAEVMDTPLLFVHVSAPGAARCIREAQTRGLQVYAETCPQYVTLTADHLRALHCHDPFEGAKYVCSPPPRESAADHEGIWQGMRNGTFTIVSSDHCSAQYGGDEGKRIAFKNGHNGAFRYIPNGCPGVETRMPLIYSLGVAGGRLSLQKFVELTSTNPAKLYGMYPRKGSIIAGADADLVVWYPDGAYPGPKTVKNANLNHNVDFTPYEDMPLKNWPRYTIVRGRVVFSEGRIDPASRGHGEYIARGPSSLAVPRDEWLTEWRPDYMS